MPKFETLKADEVLLGRSRLAAEARKPYVEALQAGDAGRIELDRGDNPSTVKRLLRDASKEAGIRVRSTWDDQRTQKVLLWKRVGV